MFIIGDIHGHYNTFTRLLHQETLLIDAYNNWTGGMATLCILGDYVDRGPAGIETIDFLMDIQEQAYDTGGEVIALLGNHDISLLGAYRFGDAVRKRVNRSFLDDWKRYGGQTNDLEHLTPAHVDWLTSLPAMARVDDMLLIHADSMLYTRYGQTVDEVNQTITDILSSDDLIAWDNLIEDFGEKFAFGKPGLFHNIRTAASPNARLMLDTFGGSQIVHGHTPVYRMTNQSPKNVVEPLTYANGLCVNVDACLYNEGPGVVYHLPVLV